jgi:hypothetical protein
VLGEYLAQGLPIATGVIEGARRHLVNEHMDIASARWGLQHAGAILKLRSLSSSGDADGYWDFFKAQSLCQDHASRYEDCPLQEAARPFGRRYKRTAPIAFDANTHNATIAPTGCASSTSAHTAR